MARLAPDLHEQVKRQIKKNLFTHEELKLSIPILGKPPRLMQMDHDTAQMFLWRSLVESGCFSEEEDVIPRKDGSLVQAMCNQNPDLLKGIQKCNFFLSGGMQNEDLSHMKQSMHTFRERFPPVGHLATLNPIPQSTRTTRAPDWKFLSNEQELGQFVEYQHLCESITQSLCKSFEKLTVKLANYLKRVQRSEILKQARKELFPEHPAANVRACIVAVRKHSSSPRAIKVDGKDKLRVDIELFVGLTIVRPCEWRSDARRKKKRKKKRGASRLLQNGKLRKRWYHHTHERKNAQFSNGIHLVARMCRNNAVDEITAELADRHCALLYRKDDVMRAMCCFSKEVFRLRHIEAMPKDVGQLPFWTDLNEINLPDQYFSPTQQSTVKVETRGDDTMGEDSKFPGTTIMKIFLSLSRRRVGGGFAQTAEILKLTNFTDRSTMGLVGRLQECCFESLSNRIGTTTPKMQSSGSGDKRVKLISLPLKFLFPVLNTAHKSDVLIWPILEANDNSCIYLEKKDDGVNYRFPWRQRKKQKEPPRGSPPAPSIQVSVDMQVDSEKKEPEKGEKQVGFEEPPGSQVPESEEKQVEKKVGLDDTRKIFNVTKAVTPFSPLETFGNVGAEMTPLFMKSGKVVFDNEKSKENLRVQIAVMTVFEKTGCNFAALMSRIGARMQEQLLDRDDDLKEFSKRVQDFEWPANDKPLDWSQLEQMCSIQEEVFKHSGTSISALIDKDPHDDTILKMAMLASAFQSVSVHKFYTLTLERPSERPGRYMKLVDDKVEIYYLDRMNVLCKATLEKKTTDQSKTSEESSIIKPKKNTVHFSTKSWSFKVRVDGPEREKLSDKHGLHKNLIGIIDKLAGSGDAPETSEEHATVTVTLTPSQSESDIEINLEDVHFMDCAFLTFIADRVGIFTSQVRNNPPRHQIKP